MGIGKPAAVADTRAKGVRGMPATLTHSLSLSLASALLSLPPCLPVSLTLAPETLAETTSLAHTHSPTHAHSQMVEDEEASGLRRKYMYTCLPSIPRILSLSLFSEMRAKRWRKKSGHMTQEIKSQTLTVSLLPLSLSLDAD